VATVRTSIQLYDQFSGVLNGVIKSLNLTVAAMGDVQDAMDRGFNPGTIHAARAAIQQAEAELRSLASPIDQASDAQDRLNRAMQRGESSASGLLSTIKGLAAAYLSIEGAERLTEATIGGAMEQRRMLDLFIARAGEAGIEMFETFRQQALEAGQDVNQTLQSALSFLSATQDIELLKQLNELAIRLAAFDTTGQGIEGAAFALKEALSGDIVSLAERFNMSRSLIRAMRIDELGKAGDIEGFIQAMDALLEKQRMGQQAFEQMLSSPAVQAQMLANTIRSEFAGAGQEALAAILPFVTTLRENFAAGQYDAFFSGLSNGIARVTQIVLAAANAALWLGSVITTNWSLIEPIVWGLVGAMTAYWAVTRGVAMATQLAAAAQMLWNNVIKAHPVALIIGAVAALILWLIKLYRTNDQVAAALMRAWNAVLNFMDQVPIFWAKVGFGILSALLTVKVKTLEILESLVNGAIKAINWLIDKVNKIPGVSIQAIEQVEFASRAAVEAEAARQAAAAMIAQMEADAALRAAEREQRVADMLAARAARRAEEQAALAMPDLSALASGPLEVDSVGTVDEVGKIRDTVDISAEDLRIMRELAEMRQNQYFVTLTPTVTVNTGDINNGYDVDTIINRIKVVLEEEIASSAKAVFA